jgi:hypothetical protein
MHTVLSGVDREGSCCCEQQLPRNPGCPLDEATVEYYWHLHSIKQPDDQRDDAVAGPRRTSAIVAGSIGLSCTITTAAVISRHPPKRTPGPPPPRDDETADLNNSPGGSAGPKEGHSGTGRCAARCAWSRCSVEHRHEGLRSQLLCGVPAVERDRVSGSADSGSPTNSVVFSRP